MKWFCFVLFISRIAFSQSVVELKRENSTVNVPVSLISDRNLRWIGTTHPDHCDSVKEYKAALDFLRKQKEVSPSEGRARELAENISKGCNGAAERFAKVMLLLVRAGVDHSKAINVALLFSKEDDETSKNFYEIFQKTYLGEFFDLDYQTAINISYELSRDYEGNKQVARDDFLKLTKFCFDKAEMNLPSRICADLSLKMARLSQYYPGGVFNPFLRMYRMLREGGKFGLDIRSSVNVIEEIMPFGPKAPDNFINGFDYALSPDGLRLTGKDAISFGIKMARLSARDLPPPIYDPVKKPIPQVKTEGKKAE